MAEQHTPRVHAESVVLDIGDDAGALVIYTTGDLVGKELEISRLTPGSQRTHTDVHERRQNDKTLYTAVFSSLPAGDYQLWGIDAKPVSEVTIVGGQVTEVDWR